MDLLGIGPMEALLVFILALILFGPAKLPEIGQSFGKTVYELRRSVREFSADLARESEAAKSAPALEQPRPDTPEGPQEPAP